MKKSFACKCLSTALASALLLSTALPSMVRAHSDQPAADDSAYTAPSEADSALPAAEEEIVDANILLGKTPTTNSDTPVTGGGDSTQSGVMIQNPSYATDDDIGNTDADGSEHSNTKIVAGTEDPNQTDNGWAGWKDVYLEYDFGKTQEVKEVKLYRNTYSNAISTFKNVKVELSENPEFSNPTVIFGGTSGQDVAETEQTKGKPQEIKLQTPVKARYIRIWQRGHYIQNLPLGGWKGMSNGVLFNEIQVIAPVPKSEVPTQPQGQVQNIALGKLPYVRGLTPTNIEAITDGKADNNYAVHNSLGNRWLQFEYKNKYNIKQIKFKLEEGAYQSVEISISNSPKNQGTVVWSQKNWTQDADMVTVDLNKGTSGRYVRFTVNRADDQPTKYSEIEIWATGTSFDESKPEYTAPDSKYDTLVWSDEFDGSTLDTDKWQIIDGMANHGAIYNKQAVSVRDGYLVLNSKNYGTTEKLIEAVGWDQYHDQKLKNHVTWSSGRVESKNKFSFQFGRVAVRAKPNDSKGIWPAIWMLCQDETGHDEIDILEYLGQDSWDAWTTNHYGILNKNKKSDGIATQNYEAWSQDFHVFEAEWDPEQITFYIDGKRVHSTTAGREDLDAMHTRPMFLILETQVGDGWVGPVDYDRQDTKQDSDYLIDWVRVYQKSDQPTARFDDLTDIRGGYVDDPYMIGAVYASDGLQQIHHVDGAENPSWQDKDNFFYGGQPRVETDRVAVSENAASGQSLIYRIAQAKDVHLTAYYQSLSDGTTSNNGGWFDGTSIRTTLQNHANIDFKVYTSPDASSWTLFEQLKAVENHVDEYPGYARVTFDAYGLPAGTNYVKVEFPQYKGVQYQLKDGTVKDLLNTDIQLAKVTFLQEKGASDEQVPTIAVSIDGAAEGAGQYHPWDTVTLKAGERAGYRFGGWRVLKGSVRLDHPDQPTAQFTMPNESVSIEAVWTPIPYTLTVVDSYAQNSGAGEYTVEDQVTVRAGTRDGYDFAGWKVVSGSPTLEQAASPEITFQMPDEAVTLQAMWSQKQTTPTQPSTAPANPTTAPTKPAKPNGTPNTGDGSSPALWAAMAALSGLAVVAISVKKQRDPD